MLYVSQFTHRGCLLEQATSGANSAIYECKHVRLLRFSRLLALVLAAQLYDEGCVARRHLQHPICAFSNGSAISTDTQFTLLTCPHIDSYDRAIAD